MERIKRYYDGNPEKEMNRLTGDIYHSIESEITKRFMEDYLRPGNMVADIGCGTGHYSIWLMEKGHRTLMADLSQGLLDLAAKEIEQRKLANYLIGIKQLSATNLSEIESSTYDVTLLLGPLYHLLDKNDRKMAMREACRIIKPNGLIFSAVINRLCPIRDMMFGSTESFAEEIGNDYQKVLQLLETGIYQNESEDPHAFTDAYFAPVDEVPSLYREEGVELLKTFSCEGIAAFLDDRAVKLKEHPKAWDNFIDLVYRTSTDPSIVGSGEHTVFIGRKLP